MEDLEKLRKKLDRIDEKLVDLIFQRISLIPKIAEFKKQKDLPRKDKKREESIRKKLLKLSNKKGLNPELVEKIIDLLIEESHRIEKDILGK